MMNDEEKKCDLEVKLILKKQYKNDCLKYFFNALINKKRKTNKNYSNLELLADIALYYKKIDETINLADEILEMVNKKLKPNNSFDTNNFLNWHELREKTINKIIHEETISNLSNHKVINNKITT